MIIADLILDISTGETSVMLIDSREFGEDVNMLIPALVGDDYI